MASELGSAVSSQYYSYDYYSGANIGIWFRDLLVTDIVGIEFSLLQTKKPVWGYASQLYDGVAGGVVQVSGVLYMNFTRSQFLPALIERTVVSTSQNDTLEIANSTLTEADVLARTGVKGGFTHYVTRQNIELLKQRYWENSGEPGFDANISSIPISVNRPDWHMTPFEVRINYGDPLAIISNGSPTSIDLGGQNRTLRKLKGVHITGFGQSIQINGEPVIESYPFLAREVT